MWVKVCRCRHGVSYFLACCFRRRDGRNNRIFYGKRKFAVKGFGEVNKKSLEGCAAVFIFSLGATILSTFVVRPDELTMQWEMLPPICVATLSTLTETIAFRSTDNFLIPVCNAILVISVYANVRSEQTKQMFLQYGH